MNRPVNLRFAELLKKQNGVSLLEVIVGLLFATIVAMGITKSTMGSEKVASRTIHNSEAMQIALEIIEQYASVDPQMLDSSDALAVQEVVRNGYRFTREVDVIINPDRSRTVAVNVKSISPLINLDLLVEDTFALWGER